MNYVLQIYKLFFKENEVKETKFPYHLKKEKEKKGKKRKRKKNSLSKK